MISQELREYLDGVVGIVEANSYEHHALWCSYAEEGEKFGAAERKRYTWKETRHGYLPTVGEFGGMPVVISLLTATVNGHKLLFYYATSQVVDHRQVEQWLKDNLPDSAKRADGYLNKTDAMNFCNVFPREMA